MEGWISLHRKTRNHWIHDNPVYFRAWVDILMQVNHSDNKVLIQGELIPCLRGESIMSLQSWVKYLGKGWTIHKVRTFFDLLQKDKMILVKGMRKTSRLTVCNYGNYQFRWQADVKQTSSRRQADVKLTSTNNNDNNSNTLKNEDNPIPGNSDFFESIVSLFKEIYEEINSIPYAVSTKKDYAAAVELVKIIKSETGLTEEEELKTYFETYFRQIINHPDRFQKEHMTLSYLVNNFNPVNNTYKSKTGVFTASELVHLVESIKNTTCDNPMAESAKDDLSDNTKPVIPPFSEVNEFFNINGYTTDAADRFYGSLLHSDNRDKIIPYWKEYAKKYYFIDKYKI